MAKAGRKKKPAGSGLDKNFNARCSAETYAALERYAKARGQTMRAAATNLLSAGLEATSNKQTSNYADSFNFLVQQIASQCSVIFDSKDPEQASKWATDQFCFDAFTIVLNNFMAVLRPVSESKIPQQVVKNKKLSAELRTILSSSENLAKYVSWQLSHEMMYATADFQWQSLRNGQTSEKTAAKISIYQENFVKLRKLFNLEGRNPLDHPIKPFPLAVSEEE